MFSSRSFATSVSETDGMPAKRYMIEPFCLRRQSFQGARARIALDESQGLSLEQSLQAVQLQDSNGDGADVGQRLDSVALQAKVLTPAIRARIEESNEGAGLPDDGADV